MPCSDAFGQQMRKACDIVGGCDRVAYHRPMKTEHPVPSEGPAMTGRATLKLASYQKPERRETIERRESAKRALVGERRSASQRVLRALFGT